MERLVILGSGESGLGAARLARKHGYEVLVSDRSPISDSTKNVLSRIGASYEEQGHSGAIYDASLLIKSPGIPGDIPVLQKFRANGGQVISEVEFASRFTQGRIIAITGSNGKTTTATLTHHILQKAGLDVILAGNVGNSFAGELAERDPDYWVLEISSFQLDDIVEFNPDVAILLNITPDHLDRYQYEFNRYADAKFRVGMNQGENQHFIYCADDPETIKGFDRNDLGASAHAFSTEKQLSEGAWLHDEHLHISLYNKLSTTMSIYKLALQGKHNIYNSMAAGMAASVLDIKSETIRESLSDFQQIEHRLEYVTKVNGIEYINDSKATNVNATWYALESMKQDVVWIVGGVDKGNDYNQLLPLVKDKVKAIVCLGKDNSPILKAFEGEVEHIYETHSAADAVKLSSLIARKGDTVLLSPSCASFDLFADYEDRGRQFKRAVKLL